MHSGCPIDDPMCAAHAAIESGAAAWRFMTEVITVAIGTGVGASVAFVVERAKRKRENQDRQVESINSAIYALSGAWNDIEIFKKQRLEEAVNSPIPWYCLHPGPMTPLPPTFDTGELGFLFDGPTANLPAEVRLSLERYYALRQILEEYSKWHLGVAQPRLQKVVIAGGQITPQAISDIVGPQAAGILQEAFKGIVQVTADVLPHLLKTMSDLRTEGLRRYPKRTFVRIERVQAT